MAIIVHYFTEFSNFGASYVIVVKMRPVLFVTECSQKNLLFRSILFMATLSELTANKSF